MAIAKGDGTFVEESNEDFQMFLNDPFFVHYVGMINPPRPGVVECIELLGHTHFAADTPRNDLFHLRVAGWMGMTWAIVSIPIEDKALMEKAAEESGLRAVQGIPVILEGKEVYRFPAANERCFTLENMPGHPVYRKQ